MIKYILTKSLKNLNLNVENLPTLVKKLSTYECGKDVEIRRQINKGFEENCGKNVENF